ncbi:MAG: hypothetical protein KHX03_09805 [Clostridium sp.]|nr:hypothetical protein [Clostridium sp.]
MKIGNAWTKTSEKGDTYIPVSLDEVILKQFPALDNYFFNLWRIPAEERKNENSPQWSLNATVKKQKEETKEAEIF